VVRTLGPGLTSASWDGKNDGGRELQAGVYFVRLSQGENLDYARLVKLQ
jgi:hypothetical protein